MTKLFLDSSALVKLFVREPGSEAMITLMERVEDRLKCTSALVMLEVRSAIRRRQYAEDVSVADADRAVSHLLEESKHLVELPITADVLQQASGLVDRHNLRALDSIQLATALIVNGQTGMDDVWFIASDHRLLRAANAEELDIWDPCESSSPPL